MAEVDAAVIEFLKTHRLGVLATGRRDGSPQQALIAYRFDGRDFMISTRAPSAKAKNVPKQPRVSLTVSDGPRVVVVYGRASLVREPEEVLRYYLTRLVSPRPSAGPSAGSGGASGQGQTEPVDQEALRRRLGKEERVVLVITPEKYLPSRFESRG